MPSPSCRSVILTRLVLVTAFVTVAIAPQPATADTSMWRVARGDDQVLIGGTVHMLDEQDFPLPDEFDAAYDEADELILETDISALQSEETQTALTRALVYPEGTTLADKVSPETLERFKAFLKERQLPVKQFLTFKPGMITAGLTGLELQRLGIDSAGVDQHYNDKARKDGVRLSGLESVEQQIGFIAAIGETNPDAVVSGLLDEVESLGDLMKSAVAAWRAGDLEQIEAEIVAPMREDYPLMYDSLIRSRNADWLPLIEQQFGNDERELILVGAAHLAGEDGLLGALVGKGYTVEPY